ncbi:hypothetical protein [Streptomyces sp. NPDC048200]|uniref:hypothetical protein n=1 Tax=Streptomyces sp. NPDC048200 TaxID=3365512 RepID=UPI00372347B3
MSDTGNDEPLEDAHIVTDNNPIHYRIHDADGAGLLGFGRARPGLARCLQIAEHYRPIQAAKPGRALVLRQYDRPAGDQFEPMTGP